ARGGPVRLRGTDAPAGGGAGDDGAGAARDGGERRGAGVERGEDAAFVAACGGGAGETGRGAARGVRERGDAGDTAFDGVAACAIDDSVAVAAAGGAGGDARREPPHHFSAGREAGARGTGGAVRVPGVAADAGDGARDGDGLRV